MTGPIWPDPTGWHAFACRALPATHALNRHLAAEPLAALQQRPAMQPDARAPFLEH